MKYLPFACWMVAALLVSGSRPAEGVDPNRAAAQIQAAPAWAQTTPNAFNNPAFGYSTPPGDPNRNRTSASIPSQPGMTAIPSYNQPAFSQSAPQKWRLGIYPDNTDLGITVREVVPGSAAQRAGLEVNDRIITAHGYQVGYVDGTLYDIGQEFERHADANGWVRVLVQDSRTGQLRNLPIKLDGRSEGLTGMITYRSATALPATAVAVVELREIVRSDVKPITLARQTISGSRTSPIQFSLDYDPTQIDPRRTYVMHATIESKGRQLFATQRPVPVLGNNPSKNLQLPVEPITLPGGTAPMSRDQQLAQISQWFRTYLGREPRAQEMYVWEAHLARGGTLADAQLQILSTPEFYYQCNADDTEYIRRMFQLVTNRQPTQQEITMWLSRLNYYNRLRPEVAKEFLSSVAAVQT